MSINIFEWLEGPLQALREDDPQLAHDVEHLSHWAVSGQQARLRAALPRILAEVRRRSMPWLEIYARHWGLQSGLARHYRLKEGLAEAVSLIDRAHRDDARDCPQTICATQDLCIAYRVVDGPGYAAERERAARETLARIHPGWPCWRCIGEELIDALVEQGRPEEAMAWVEANFDVAQRRDSVEIVPRMLVELGRFDEAVAHLETVDWDQQPETVRVGRPVVDAWVAARAGRLEDAASMLPPWSPQLAEACEYHEQYVETLARVVEAGHVEETLEHTQQLTWIARELADRGAVRPAVNVSLMWAAHQLAGSSASLTLARRFLEHAEGLLPSLRSDLDRRRAEAVRAELDARTVDVPADLDAAKAWLAERDDHSFDQLDALVRAFPGWGELARGVAEHWRRRGWPEEAHALLRAAMDASPEDVGVRLAWIEQLVQEGDWDRLEPLVEALPDADPELAQHRRWYLGRIAEGRGDVDAAVAHYRSMVDADPDWCGQGLFHRLAGLLRAAGRDEEALELWTTAVRHNPGWARERWERIVYASALGRWDLVREDAAALEVEVEPGEGPIDEDWATVLLRLPGEEGGLYARRTGPATARIRAIRTPATPERYGEVWTFLPAPVAENAHGVRTYEARTQIGSGDFVCFTIDGVVLGEPAVERLEALARQQGGEILLYSGDGYVLTDPSSDHRRDAQYRKVAVPRARLDAAAWVEALRAIAGELDGPLVWLELWPHVEGGGAEAEEQRQTAARWGM